MTEEGRKRKLVLMSSVFLHDWMSVGPAYQVQCVEGLPNDARFVGMSYDYQRDLYGLCFESETWEPIPLGQMLPTINPRYRLWQLQPLFDQAAAWITELPRTKERDRWLIEWQEMRARMEVGV